VHELAARQRGVVTREQLYSVGLSRSAIWRASSAGLLHPLHRGVYGVMPPPTLPELAREQAAVLALGGRAVLSHASAAALWQLPVAPPPDEVELTVLGRDASRPREGLRIHRTSDLDRSEIRRHRGLPLTSPARTLLDLAPSLSDRRLEALFDEALVRGLMRRAHARDIAARHPRRPGMTRFRELAFEDRATTMTRAESEERMLALVRRAGLPAPEVNVRNGQFELDFLWREERVVVEIDGHTFHSSRRALERDHRRDLALQAAGFIVLRFTWREVRDQPEMVIAELAGVLALRRAS